LRMMVSHGLITVVQLGQKELAKLILMT